MVRFEHPEFLYALAVWPILILLYLFLVWNRKKHLKSFGDIRLVLYLIPDYSPARQAVKFFLFFLAIGFLILAMANPQTGSKLEQVERKGIDIVIALDVSNSMLAEDIRPNRIEKSRQAISRLIDRLSQDRLGIIIFAGKAYVQLPITTDYAAAKLFLNSINTEIIPTQGTAIGEAIQLSVSSFPEGAHGKAIIIISDGENHEDDAVGAATLAAEQGISVNTIGMGLPEGGPIPVFKGNILQGFKKDQSGNTVVTRLNEVMLQQIAAAGNGIYVRASNEDPGLDRIFDRMSKLEKSTFDAKTFSDYDSHYHYFVIIALLLLAIDIFISERRSRWFRHFNPFKINPFGGVTK
ncbi:MAG TPA: VWA domain-containing protein [Bacteroidales bacterium]|nr:VWA domain-containing protein [Bacteroidales bacterium]